jgi:hypothetical protein
MRRILTVAIAASVASLPFAAMAAPRKSASPDIREGVRAGTLECQVEGSVSLFIGSNRNMECVFRAGRGAPQRYTGSIGRLGLDVGVTGRSVMVWQVVATSGDVRKGSLAGSYRGVSVGASAVVGANANVLVGGGDGSFNLQPLSVEGQRGVNLAAGVASLTLRPAGRG